MMRVLLSTVLFLLTSLPRPASGFTVASPGQQRMVSSIPVAFTPRSTNQKSVLYMSDSSDVQAGTVKWFNTVKGFGFITPNDGGDDIFVHQTAIQAEGFRSLADGEEVEFQVQLDATGRKKATNVTGPKGAAVKGAPFRPQSDYGTY